MLKEFYALIFYCHWAKTNMNWNQANKENMTHFNLIFSRHPFPLKL